MRKRWFVRGLRDRALFCFFLPDAVKGALAKRLLSIMAKEKCIFAYADELRKEVSDVSRTSPLVIF